MIGGHFQPAAHPNTLTTGTGFAQKLRLLNGSYPEKLNYIRQTVWKVPRFSLYTTVILPLHSQRAVAQKRHFCPVRQSNCHTKQ